MTIKVIEQMLALTEKEKAQFCLTALIKDRKRIVEQYGEEMYQRSLDYLKSVNDTLKFTQ